jgi:hypothetical protein
VPSKMHVVFAALGGIAVGAAASYWGISNMSQSAVGTYAAYELTEQERQAVSAFADLEPKANVLVQKGLIDYVTRQYTIGWVEQAQYHRVAGFAHARLAQALIELGDTTRSDAEAQEALTHLSQIGKSVTKEELLEVIRNGRRAPSR